MKDENQIKIELSNKEALVLFAILSRFSESEKISIEDSSEKWVFEDLLALLEKQLVEPFKDNYDVLLEKAREEIRLNHEGNE